MPCFIMGQVKRRPASSTTQAEAGSSSREQREPMHHILTKQLPLLQLASSKTTMIPAQEHEYNHEGSLRYLGP
jgi:hypothetical protein